MRYYLFYFAIVLGHSGTGERESDGMLPLSSKDVTNDQQAVEAFEKLRRKKKFSARPGAGNLL